MASTKSISHDKTCSIDMNLYMVYTCPYPRNKQSNDQIGLIQTTQKQKLSVTSRTFILISRTNWHAHRFDFKHSQNMCQNSTIQLTRTLIAYTITCKKHKNKNMISYYSTKEVNIMLFCYWIWGKDCLLCDVLMVSCTGRLRRDLLHIGNENLLLWSAVYSLQQRRLLWWPAPRLWQYRLLLLRPVLAVQTHLLPGHDRAASVPWRLLWRSPLRLGQGRLSPGRDLRAISSQIPRQRQ